MATVFLVLQNLRIQKKEGYRRLLSPPLPCTYDEKRFACFALLSKGSTYPVRDHLDQLKSQKRLPEIPQVLSLHGHFSHLKNHCILYHFSSSLVHPFMS